MRGAAALIAAVILVGVGVGAPPARGASSEQVPGVEAPSSPSPEGAHRENVSGPGCGVGVPGVDEVLEGACEVGEAIGKGVEKCSSAPTPETTLACAGASAGAETAGKVAGSVARSVASGIMGQLTSWMTEAATWVTEQVTKGIQATTTPELSSSWYSARYESMAALGMGLALLVALAGLTSAALRRDPHATAAIFFGMWRAGLATGLVVALTVMGLALADSITSDIATSGLGVNAHNFWASVAHTWKGPEGAIASSAVTFLLALVMVVAGVAVWIEQLFRAAAIYVAVLFFPAATAAAIWPRFRKWEDRLVSALVAFVIMKPVTIAVLTLAGSAAVAGLSGTKGAIGVILAAVVIFALAAWSPWAVLALVAETGEAAATITGGAARGALSGAGSAVGGGVGSVGRVGSSVGRIGGGRARGEHAGGGAGRGGGAGGAGRGSGAGGAGAGAKGGSSAGGAAASSGGAGGGAAAGAVGAVGAVAAAAGMTHAAGKQTGAGAAARVGAAHGENGGQRSASTSSGAGGGRSQAAGGSSSPPSQPARAGGSSPRPGASSPTRGGSGGGSPPAAPPGGGKPA